MKVDVKTMLIVPENEEDVLWLLKTCQFYRAKGQYEEWYYSANTKEKETALTSCQNHMIFNPLFKAYRNHIETLRKKMKKWLAILISETILIIILILMYLNTLS
ncbi:hypothetical protein [Listeria booriae]|uniref:Uncharacterized protein n=1 Tax=Listeria booriae TaxID=1552123 RepID=A0A842FAM5_9LIST|nr:hypothetical protein [Listeria booriae]MBC2241852.1 hypothetical protein [Listeria booriae]